MIIGAGGSLGKCLCKVLLKDHNVVVVDISENSLAYLSRVCDIKEDHIYIEDIRNFDKIRMVMEYHKIDLVINCAAMKHVVWCEYNIGYAIDVNVIANLELINYLKKNNKKFIYISSDKAYKPKNIYALTKQFTDYIVKAHDFKLVRGVNFINSKGSVLDLWEEQRIVGHPFTIVNENCDRYFMTIKQMADLVREAINDDSCKKEYIPSSVYKIYIHDLFEAYLKLNGIVDYDTKEIKLLNTEKISEDLDFNTDIIELNNIDKIVNIIK